MKYAAPAIIAFLIAVMLTPLVRRISLRIGMVDKPDGHRKLHTSATPLGGGVAILAAMLCAIALTVIFNFDISGAIRREPYFTIGLFGAGTLICIVGLIDDRFDLRGRQKLASQCVCVGLVIFSGLEIERFELFGYEIALGLLSKPITAFWLLGAINALNLIDGVDGLAGTVGVILSATIGALAYMMGHHVAATFAFVLSGAVAGFLIYNLPPAKIYLGDAGSMLIGLVLGVLAIRGSLKGPATVALAAPTAIWAILMFDVLMAVFRRKLTGQSVYASDRSHLHHVLQNRGFSVANVVLTIGLLCAICAFGALVSVAYKSEYMALGTSIAVLATMVVTGLFGRSECGLFYQRSRNLIMSVIRMPHQPKKKQLAVCSRFHGNREWELLWSALVDYADRFDLSIVQLNVSSPSIGEEYHATWERKDHPPLNRQWRTEVPLFSNHLCVGRLTVLGTAGEGQVVAWMSELIEGLKPFEVQFTKLLEGDRVGEKPSPHKITPVSEKM